MIFLFLLLLLFSEFIHCNVDYQPTLEEINIDISDSDWNKVNDKGNKGTEYNVVVTWRGSKYNSTIELHGGSSASYQKKNFRLKFPPGGGDLSPKFKLFDYGNEQAEPERIRRIVLNCAFIDGSFSINKIVHDISLRMGAFAPRSTYTILNINEKYYGLYVIIERIDDKYVENILKANETTAEVTKTYNHDGTLGPEWRKGFQLTFSPDNEMTQTARLVALLRDTPVTFDAWETSIRPEIDLRSFMLYLIAHIFTGECDGYDKNYYLAIDQTYRLKYTMISWDSDCALGTRWDGIALPANETARSVINTKNALFDKMYQIPEYRKAYIRLFWRMKTTILKEENLIPMTNELKTFLEPIYDKDFQKWKSVFKSTRLQLEPSFDRIALSIGIRHQLLETLLKQQCSMDEIDCENDSEYDKSLIISELHINIDQSSFIEFENVGDEDIDLSGFSIVGSVKALFGGQQTLKPGERLLFVENRAKFVERFGNEPTIHAEFEGILPFRLGTIEVLDVSFYTVFSLQFGDSLWPILQEKPCSAWVPRQDVDVNSLLKDGSSDGTLWEIAQPSPNAMTAKDLLCSNAQASSIAFLSAAPDSTTVAATSSFTVQLNDINSTVSRVLNNTAAQTSHTPTWNGLSAMMLAIIAFGAACCIAIVCVAAALFFTRSSSSSTNDTSYDTNVAMAQFDNPSQSYFPPETTTYAPPTTQQSQFFPRESQSTFGNSFQSNQSFQQPNQSFQQPNQSFRQPNESFRQPQQDYNQQPQQDYNQQPQQDYANNQPQYFDAQSARYDANSYNQAPQQQYDQQQYDQQQYQSYQQQPHQHYHSQDQQQQQQYDQQYQQSYDQNNMPTSYDSSMRSLPPAPAWN